jgi:hypothetical protein
VTAPIQTAAGWRSVVANPSVLWSAFVVVHFWLGFVNLYGPGLPLGDVTIVYRFWTDQAVVAHYWVGIDASWVYPIVAWVPMLAARVFGVADYAGTWLALVMLLDAGAFAALIGWGHRRQNSAIAWWWLGFLMLLGPIALGRIDSITIPLAIVGVLLVATRPRTAALILTVATWIKVWPAALIAAMLIAVRARLRVLLTAVVASAAIVLYALLLGSGWNVFSFVGQQAGRGLQVEAPISTPWLWRALAGLGHTSVYYDTTLLTWQVRGDGVALAASLMTPVLVIVMLGIAVVGVLAVRNRAPVTDVLPVLSLAFVTAFIAFNKVGSPQYVTWLAVPVILGLATRASGHGRRFAVPATLAVVIAALTQVIYPYLYGWLLGLNVVMLMVITAKDVLLFALLAWAVASLVQSARLREPGPSFDGSEWLPVVWPFSAAGERESLETEKVPD